MVRRALKVLAAVLLLSPVVPATAAPPPVGPRSRPATTVTLITGDQVTLAGPAIAVEPGPGRQGITFSTRRVGERLEVVPSDVAALVTSGKLDRRLFDVTGLVRDGYDDTRRADIPLIVRYRSSSAVRAMAGARTVRALPAIRSAGVRVAKQDAGTFATQVRAGDIERIWLDGRRRVTLDQSVPQIGAPAAWDTGHTGKGVTIAVLDTGVDATHTDLAGRVGEAVDFTGTGAGDKVGHGTHVASIAAGRRGVARDARIIDGKVCADRGCDESAILAGMTWAAVDQRARVINLSLGAGDLPEIDPLEQAVNELTAATGALFVVAAGNSGFAGIDSPGSADAALTVGAVDKQEDVASFSARGPRSGDHALKPDLSAPGVGIVAARAAGTEIGDPVGTDQTRLSGTSMATPHVAGVAALLAQQHAGWTSPELKSALVSTSKPNPALTPLEQGAGRVDAARAVTQTVIPTTSSLSFGTLSWPHTDDEKLTETLTYANHGTTAVTLALAADLRGPEGEAAPADAVTLSASSLTIPAGGEAGVTVTISARPGGPVGHYSGRVTASGPGVSVVTALQVYQEVESYDVTIHHLGLDGEPTGQGGTILAGLAPEQADLTYRPRPHRAAVGTVTYRVPKGDYLAMGEIQAEVNGRPTLHKLVQPLFRVDGDKVLTIDARQAKPVTTTVDNRTVRPRLVTVGFARFQGGSAVIDIGHLAPDFGTLFTGQLGESVPEDGMRTWIHSTWGVPGEDGEFGDSPVTYHLYDTVSGGYPTGFARAVRSSELARLADSQHPQLTDRNAIKFLFNAGGHFTTGYRYRLPSKATHLVEPGSWTTRFHEFTQEPGRPRLDRTQLTESDREFRAGTTVRRSWNGAVAGPSVGSPNGILVRSGNNLLAGWYPFADAAGHGGLSAGDTAVTRLSRNGTVLAESGDAGYLEVADLPAERSRYVLESSVSRPSFADLSTEVRVRWSFASQTAAEEGEVLPLRAVRFHPAVDAHNMMPREPVSTVPLRIDAPEGVDPAALKSLVVQVSGDEGKTWQPAAVGRLGPGQYQARFATPIKAAYVSLRANLAGTDGTSADQTIIRAYGLR